MHEVAAGARDVAKKKALGILAGCSLTRTLGVRTLLLFDRSFGERDGTWKALEEVLIISTGTGSL